MNRRTFLKTASVAGLAAAPASAVLGYSPQHVEQKTPPSGSHPDHESPEHILLKDYRPKSIYKIPVTEIARSRFPIIDMHSHPYAKTAEEIAEWVKTMDAVGVEKTVILTSSVGAEFDATNRQYSKYPDRFEMWCGFDYAGYDRPGFGAAAVRELERCHQAGARGVGELHDKGQVGSKLIGSDAFQETDITGITLPITKH
ncbi:MAG: twin-arginine translocation signal domain-containing protein, partial [Terriglobales bacterium]